MVIGRNEGERLKRCLSVLRRHSGRIVYVDSGSTDGSAAFAAESGVTVVELPDNEPFTAARSRNEGLARLADQWPGTEFVMFIDGDCELIDGFALAAVKMLDEDQTIGIVTGRCRERFADATIYNRLCDMEWNGPVGDIDACGGIFMTRLSTFREAGGFNTAIIAAEDDDFCIRVRANGKRVHRVDRDMCFHDADMRRFSQWWRRAVRAGYAFAQVGEMHPGYFRSQRLRAWLWGLVLPAAIIFPAPLTSGWSAILLLLYVLSFIRTRHGLIRNGATAKHASLYAGFLTLSKFPNLIGMLNYRRKRLMGRPVGLVEYK